MSRATSVRGFSGFAGSGPSCVERFGERVTTAGDARPDGADRAADHLGGLRVWQSDELGEHDRFALVQRQRVEELGRLDFAVRVWCGACREVGDGVGAPSGAFAEVFEAHVPADAEDPGHHRSSFPTLQVGHDPDERFLGEVIGIGWAGEMGAESPDVGLDRPDEAVERDAVAGGGRCGESVQVMHSQQSGGFVGNFTNPSRHTSDMVCAAIREVLSARLDQESTTEEEVVANAHLGRCVPCQAWWSEMGQVNRVLRVRLAETIPDLASGVLARAHPPSVGRRQWVRLSLAAVAVTELVLATPGLLLGEGAASVHDARHLGSFGVAMSIGLVYVAWRPARAFGILPIVVALAVTMFVSAVVDVAHGRTTSISEAHHVLEVAGLVLVWMLAGRPVPRRFRPLIQQPGGRHHFHHV